MTAVRFMLDEHMDRAVALGLRRRELEARTVHELGRRSAEDEDHLRWAYEHGWVIVSGDEDFLRLVDATDTHAGLVYYRRNRFPLGLLVRSLEALGASETMESMAGRVRYL